MLYDRDIREPLFWYLEGLYGKMRILEEKQMGKSRADAIMVTDGLLIGIEIKSDADSYARLARQVPDYDSYCDRNLIVVGDSHISHVQEHIPRYWGIISASEENERADFYLVRPPAENPMMRMEKKMQILWREELARILYRNRMPKYTGKSKRFIIGKILGRLPRETVSREITDELFEREYTQ